MSWAYWTSGQGVGFEPEYQAVLDRAVFLGYTTPDSATNIRNNNRVKYLKQTGLWTKIDLLYFFDQPSGLSEFAKINYINPLLYEVFNANPALEPDFIGDSGFKSNGTKWFNTGFNASVDGVNLTNVNATDARGSIFYRGFDFVADATFETVAGVRTVNNNLQILIAKNNATTALFRLGSILNTVSFSGTSHNSHILTSSAGTSSGQVSRVYIDGVGQPIGYSMSGSGFTNLNTYLFALNANGTASTGMTSGLKYFGYGGYFGGALTGNQEAIDLFNIMNDTYTP